MSRATELAASLPPPRKVENSTVLPVGFSSERKAFWMPILEGCGAPVVAGKSALLVVPATYMLFEESRAIPKPRSAPGWLEPRVKTVPPK